MSDHPATGPHPGQELPFPLEEHERRIRLAQSDLARRDLAGFGMCFSETVLVTDDGCEVLTDFPRRLRELR